jgi:hypothetical protein
MEIHGDSSTIFSRSSRPFFLHDRRLSGHPGRLDVGQLVAVIPPTRNARTDEGADRLGSGSAGCQVKYQQVVEQFTVEDIIAPKSGH